MDHRILWREVDLSHFTPEQCEARRAEIYREQAAAAFDLANGPLVDVCVTKETQHCSWSDDHRAGTLCGYAVASQSG